ncbi:MAG: hypothetical protein K2M31_03355 [Muribaculaceae bacterium]|nr:hypothetical protein [Muribaculaceae bacterium]
MTKKNTIIILIALIFCLFFLAILSLGGCNPDCDGEACWKEIGFATKKDYQHRDSIFLANNPSLANRVNVYIENSASMDGYVDGHTSFKTTIHRFCGHLKADVLRDGKNFNYCFINSDTIIPIPLKNDNYTKDLTSESFKIKGGDRANSDIIGLIRKVVNTTNPGEISMFVSDCVYSPEPSEDIFKALSIQQTDMNNILKEKYKSNSNFGVLLFRMVSDFNGIYYTKTNAHIPINRGQRPYFIWFFGDQSILSSVYHSILSVVQEEKAEYLVGIPGYTYLPYKTIGSPHPYHYTGTKADTEQDSVSFYNCKFEADLSYLPISNKYIQDISNYTTPSKRIWELTKIEVLTQDIGGKLKKNEIPYNMKYSLRIFGKYNNSIPKRKIEISLKSMLDELPDWVTKYDDPKGDDYNNGYIPDKQRTFGLKSLVEGIRDFYGESNYVTFNILVN